MSLQDYLEIEKHYENPDPWGYQNNPCDQRRKKIIIQAAQAFTLTHYNMALDIGAGEGWITKDLPARFKFGFEISEKARDRMPKEVTPVTDTFLGVYDLVTATGVMYGHYDYKRFLDLIRRCCSNVVITCNIKDWEIPELGDSKYMLEQIGLKQVYGKEFPYREYIQKLRVFKYAVTAQHRREDQFELQHGQGSSGD